MHIKVGKFFLCLDYFYSGKRQRFTYPLFCTRDDRTIFPPFRSSLSRRVGSIGGRASRGSPGSGEPTFQIQTRSASSRCQSFWESSWTLASKSFVKNVSKWFFVSKFHPNFFRKLTKIFFVKFENCFGKIRSGKLGLFYQQIFVSRLSKVTLVGVIFQIKNIYFRFDTF